QRVSYSPTAISITIRYNSGREYVQQGAATEGLPVIEVDESDEITVAVRADELLKGDTADPKRHAIALRRQDDVDDARVTKNDTLVRRGKKWFRYDAPDKRLFKQLQKTLTT